MADVTKITLPNGTTKDIKDATARAQANWNTNNGVKNFATINNFSNTGYYKDVPVDGSLTGNVTVYIGNIISTDTDTNKCAVLFIYTDDTSSPIHLVNRGTASSFSANLEANTLKSVRIYSSDNYVHSSGDTVTVTNFMICPKSLYDADTTYQPYSLPNTKITPELIELVDSGAKNLYNPSNTSTSASGLTGTITRNSDGSYTISGTTYGTVYYNMGSWTTPENGYYILSGGSAAESASQLIYDDHDWQTYESGNKKKLAYWTKGSTHNLYIRLGTGITISNVTFYPMICSKAAWDVSQKFVPYRMSNAELTKLTPTVKDSGNAFTVGTDYTLCDACTLTVPIPDRGIKAAHILAGLTFNSTAPRGIIISLSNDISDFNTSSKLLAKVESSDFIRLTAECFYYNYGGSNVNIYVWAKSSTSGLNRVVSSMQLLN